MTDDLDSFFQIQTLAPARPDAILPGLRPIDAGYVLTWKEYPAGGRPYRRSGMVLAPAPRARSVWVQPDEARPGEGFAVVVDSVTADDYSNATRLVGAICDYLSTVQWQRPRQLPRAVLRTDTVASGDFASARAYLHADPTCPPLPVPMSRVECGEPQVLDECYVYERWLHPMSVRPREDRRFVPVCGRCLEEGRPR